MPVLCPVASCLEKLPESESVGATACRVANCCFKELQYSAFPAKGGRLGLWRFATTTDVVRSHFAQVAERI